MTGIGEVLMFLAVVAMFAAPLERTLSHRGHTAVSLIEPVLNRAFPFMPPTPSLDALTQQASDALDQDDLSRGVAATAATYDRARDGESAPG